MKSVGKRPRVLVPLGVDAGSSAIEERHHVRRTYIEKLLKHDLVPIFLSAAMPDSMLEELYSEASGALFIGGADVDPQYYGESKHQLTVSTPERDRLELGLLEKMLPQRKPFLGICRGAQVLNVAAGGKLFQHIPDLNIKELHAPLEEVSYSHLLEGPVHDIIVEKESRAFQILGRDRIKSNSSHHQAANSLGSDLVASGKSPGGIIEIIEHQDKSFFCFGLQSHPEIFGDSDLEIFFSEFARAARE